MPGETFQIINGDIYLNGQILSRKKIKTISEVNCGSEIFQVDAFEETLPNGIKYLAVYRKNGTMQNSDKFLIPTNHYFFLGDNRDCSKDSRFLSSVGYVEFNNLVGKAKLIFFSSNKKEGNLLKFWKWDKIIRINRFLKKIK